MSATRTQAASRILVAGIGNIFLGDDGFGVEVIARLSRRALPQHAVLMDVGIRGIDLSYALMDGYDAAILVDATQRGGAPGTLYVIDPEVAGADLAPGREATALLDAHSMDPVNVLHFVRQSGATLRALRVVGCEPLTFGSEAEPAMELSAPVSEALEPAVEQVLALLDELGACHA